ncbi:hypothetical protein BVRB_9g221630 [Beta vulgaris subsp. vulgaris]|nr:hypothetical protein BVRB_9g221630 [Beta vulgaris subsp. vulgaris]
MASFRSNTFFFLALILIMGSFNVSQARHLLQTTVMPPLPTATPNMPNLPQPSLPNIPQPSTMVPSLPSNPATIPTTLPTFNFPPLPAAITSLFPNLPTSLPTNFPTTSIPFMSPPPSK